MQPITVLSLFDGMSGGQLALKRAAIPVKKYYASEIDKWAIRIAQKNFPNTIHLGDINNWREWTIDTPDLIMAGSPCQGFSRSGLKLNFDDPRSKLFFIFADILNHWQNKNPVVKFMLENVRMKQEWQNVISDRLHVKPVIVNSSLVSAQDRKRLYWTSWLFPQPDDRGILLKDVIEDGEVDRNKSYTIDANYHKGGSSDYLKRLYYRKSKRQVVKYQSVRRLMVRTEDEDGFSYRKLTPLECERLQTFPEGYTLGVSNLQRYKMLGNAFTADVVSHILLYVNRNLRGDSI